MTTKKADDDLGAGEIQKQVDKEVDQGFAGSVPDPTPNQNYTVGGVIKDKPTPETSESKPTKK